MLINILLVVSFALAANYIHHPMISLILNGIIILGMLIGLLFFFATSVGVLRFPDFFTRIHAAGKGDTLSTILILFSCSIYAITSTGQLDKTSLLPAIKILLIINFIFIGSPTATHALIEAGYNSEVDPWENKQ